jgi:hypothetical protein
MRKTMTAGTAAVAAALLLLTVTTHAVADDSLSDSIERFLQNAQNKIDETKIWKFRIEPSLRESLIYTDNVFQNAAHENPVTLTRVSGPGGTVITDPGQLAQIAGTVPAFAQSATEGRVSDFIFQSDLNTKLVLPVNEDYTKAFNGLKEMTILGVEVKNQKYFSEHDVDNTSVFINTNVFGFLSDILNVQWGNQFWIHAKDQYSHITDPLDSSLRTLSSTSLNTTHTFKEFGRKENTANLDAGWNGPKVYASAGAEMYTLSLDDHELDQASHTRYEFHEEVGSLIPGWERQKAYVRYSYATYHFEEAPVVSSTTGLFADEQVLNDAVKQEGWLGVSGPMVSEKTLFTVEGGYGAWDPRGGGLSGDTTHFAHFMGHFQAAYRPWDDQHTTFQFDYHDELGYSAISNFNFAHIGQFTILHEAIPKRLDLNFSVALSTITPSDGPARKLFETGIGATYHLYKQLDLVARYAFLHQTAHHEIVTQSAFQQGGRVYEYTIASQSSFYQNVVEVGLELHF